jgi:hypothetical protein
MGRAAGREGEEASCEFLEQNALNREDSGIKAAIALLSLGQHGRSKGLVGESLVIYHI